MLRPFKLLTVGTIGLWGLLVGLEKTHFRVSPPGVVRGVDEHRFVRILLDDFPEHLLVRLVEVLDCEHVSDHQESATQESGVKNFNRYSSTSFYLVRRST